MELLTALLVYSASCLLHELGHLVAARAAGIHVERMFLWWDLGGVALFRWRKRGVTYGIGWLPFVSYTKLDGLEELDLDERTRTRAPRRGEFLSVRPWVRVAVLLAGVVMNALLAVAGYVAGHHALATLNLVLVVWNMMPLGASDGARVSRELIALSKPHQRRDVLARCWLMWVLLAGGCTWWLSRF